MQPLRTTATHARPSRHAATIAAALAVTLASACAPLPNNAVRTAPETGGASGASSASATQSTLATAMAAATDVDLAQRARAGTLRPLGVTATALEEGAYRGVRLVATERPGAVMTWLDDVEIGDGVIELDVRGKDVFQRSFPGIAFRATSDSAYEVVYVRPFNFRTPDTLRAQHAVQYMSLPNYPWPRLRQERPEVFENPVTPAPDPNGWVHLRLLLAGDRVTIYVGDGADPDLIVETLERRPRGRLGLFGDGDFANLRIAPSTR